MTETLSQPNLEEAVQKLQLAGNARIPADIIEAAISSTSNEAKIICQSTIHEEPSSLAEARAKLHQKVGSDTEPISCSQFNSIILNSINPKFIVATESEDQEKRLTVSRTPLGKNVAAVMGGHLLNLSRTTNTPLRKLIGESKKQVENEKQEIVLNSSISTRVALLSSLVSVGEKEWVSSSDLTENLSSREVTSISLYRHIRKLLEAKIIERKNPNRESRKERDIRGYLYRIVPENSYSSPRKTVESFLAIIALTSVVDLDFIDQGLQLLDELSSDKVITPALLRRSFVNSNHTGKTFERTRKNN